MVLSFLIMLKKTVAEPDLIRERLEATCIEFLSWVTRSIFLPKNYKYTKFSTTYILLAISIL